MGEAGALISVFLLYCTGVVLSSPIAAPAWPKTYSVQGMLHLPYAEINEPFSGYFDANNKKSRVDYYNGMVSTFQRADQGDYGSTYKVAFMSNYKVMNQRNCFQVKGISEAPVSIQATLPDLTGFQSAGQEVVSGQMCDVWKMVNIVTHKKNVYTMWVSAADQTPVRYEMMGFDSLIGSHFDKYVLDYTKYSSDAIDPAIFETPANMTCGDFPGPGTSEHKILHNPMKEYIHHHDDHIQEMFQNFKKTHKPNYSGEKEHAQRLHNFRQNVRNTIRVLNGVDPAEIAKFEMGIGLYVHSKNRQGLTYSLRVNHLSDKSGEELKLMNGYRHTPGDHGAKVFDASNVDILSLPESVDWRLFGAVTPVKDQGVCGSCWSFGTAETIEGAYFLKTGDLVRLSQQQLVDCSWGEGNNGCDGGEDFRSYMWIMKNGGLTSEEQYGQYLAVDGYCHSDKVKPVAQLTGYVNITSGDQDALTAAIATKGPISVAIDASHKSLSFYANGVYYEPQCGNKPDDLDHAVLAVGYGTIMGQKYWLVKNSWSTHWGNDGYVLMAQKDNNCGVATAATFVTV